MLAGNTAEDTRLTTFNRLEKEFPPFVGGPEQVESLPQSIPVESKGSDLGNLRGILLRICLSMAVIQQFSAHETLDCS
jgi:hypothetical protein